ncbi:MAG: ethylbenzene dehydrogenase-related protein [Acidobacteriota bacterium]
MRTILITLTVGGLVAGGSACRRGPAPTPDVVAVVSATLPDDPSDPSWDAAPEHVATLLLQDLVEPRLLTRSTDAVRVRAQTNGSEIALRLQWYDASTDDLPGPGRFPDGCAVQVPVKAAPSAPDPQMGGPGQPVAITYWRADWQASVDGRADTIRDLYPNASIDHYPFEAPPLEKGSDPAQRMARLYAPAAGAGNLRGGKRDRAVEDLLAEGPGTLTPAPTTAARGHGVRTADGWAVVILRPLPDGLSPASRTIVAFAVWEGAANEAGARKMRSGWVPLSMRGIS